MEDSDGFHGSPDCLSFATSGEEPPARLGGGFFLLGGMKPRWAQENHTHPATPGGGGGVPFDYMYYAMATNGNGGFGDTLGIDDSSAGTNVTATYGGAPAVGFGNLAMWPRACRQSTTTPAYIWGNGGFLCESGLWFRITFGSPLLPTSGELFAGLMCLTPSGTDYDSFFDVGNVGVILNRNGSGEIEWICRDGDTSADVSATTAVASFAVEEPYTLTLELPKGGTEWTGTLVSGDGVNETFTYSDHPPLSGVGLSGCVTAWGGGSDTVASFVRFDALVEWPQGDGAPI